MKKTIFVLSFIAVFTAASFAAGKTIATFNKKQYMLGPDIQFSPDGKMIAFIAKDGSKYYGPSYIYTGSSARGSFKKAFNDPVGQYVWKSGSEIIYSVSEKGLVTIKSGNPATGRSRAIFTKKLKETGSGYARSMEAYNIKAIAPSGQLMVVEKSKGACVLVDLSSGKETALAGFTIPYSGNPQSTLKFSGNSKRLLLFDGRNRIYRLYEVSSSSLKLLKEIKKIKAVEPGMHYLLNEDGTEITFTLEKCKGGCYHIVYTYNFEKDKLYENITIRSGQILNVAFNRDFSKAVINDMHRKIQVFTLTVKRKEIK